ncbi:MAG: hypothetical protein HZC41_18355 [Chloroflexi bacterium]|nr:hypothetical protein [Chloroflexota bacterium]
MSDLIVIDAEIGEDGKLVIQLPPDAPRGPVKVTVRKAEAYEELDRTPEQEATLDAELKELLKPENLRGQGLTAGEIANSPEFGAWNNRTDIQDGESYVEKTRNKKRYTW